MEANVTLCYGNKLNPANGERAQSLRKEQRVLWLSLRPQVLSGMLSGRHQCTEELMQVKRQSQEL